MTIPYIPYDVMDAVLEWSDVTDGMIQGHKRPKASISDSFAYRNEDTLLARAAWIDGLGSAVKAATVMPSNTPKINGGVMLFDDQTGALSAIVDFYLLTKWKTVGDSLLGAKLLARPDSEHILIVGAGTVANGLISAYSSLFPDAHFAVWNRTPEKAADLVANYADTLNITHATDLQAAVQSADIVSSATMSTEPLVKGDWLRAGQHIDLIGAYRPDMREGDDALLKKARIFMDSYDTTLGHIGELKIPLEAGTISKEDLKGDYYTMDDWSRTPEDITLFKNGGGAHLDLMTANVILKKWTTL